MALAYEEILARRITPDTTVPQHDFLFRWGNQPCCARGELVALTGKAKSGKTFVCSLLMALAVRSQIMGLSRLHDKPLRVVWIDTEDRAHDLAASGTNQTREADDLTLFDLKADVVNSAVRAVIFH